MQHLLRQILYPKSFTTQFFFSATPLKLAYVFIKKFTYALAASFLFFDFVSVFIDLVVSLINFSV